METFSGGEDAKDWLERVSIYLEDHDDYDAARHFRILLIGPAATWFRELESVTQRSFRLLSEAFQN